MHLVNKNGIPLLQFPHFKTFEKVFHAFTTRQGGSSKVPFESLNLGFNTGDVFQRVLLNRKKLLSSLGWRLDSVVTPNQVHGNQVVLVTQELKDKGAFDHESVLHGMDGLITRAKGIILMIKVADCIPVFLYDPERQAIGIIHAGWRGTANGIINRGIKVMIDSFGSKPGNIQAGIGPGIGKCCYQVGKDVWNAFRGRGNRDSSIWRTEKGKKLYLDLKKAIFLELIGSGLKNESSYLLPSKHGRPGEGRH